MSFLETPPSIPEGNSRIGIAFFDPKRKEKYIWKDGIVPYIISLPSQELIRNTIDFFHRQLKEYEFPNLVTWKERTTEHDYVEFIISKDETTWSEVGHIGGKQEISIASWANQGHILHEMCHTLGLSHEHSRFDRQKVGVEVFGNDINFSIQGFPLGPYDKLSIMHYKAGNYEGNCKITSMNGEDLGSEKLTIHDATSIYAIYGKPCCTTKLWQTRFVQPAFRCTNCGYKYFCTICAKDHHKGHIGTHFASTLIICGDKVEDEPLNYPKITKIVGAVIVSILMFSFIFKKIR